MGYEQQLQYVAVSDDDLAFELKRLLSWRGFWAEEPFEAEVDEMTLTWTLLMPDDAFHKDGLLRLI